MLTHGAIATFYCDRELPIIFERSDDLYLRCKLAVMIGYDRTQNTVHERTNASFSGKVRTVTENAKIEFL